MADADMELEPLNRPPWKSTLANRPHGAIVTLVCLSVLLTHLPALTARAKFMDDDQYIFRNVLVQNPSWHNAWQFFREIWRPSTVSGYYQPLTMTSLMVDSALGSSPSNLAGFHRTSLLLHVLNTALIYVLLYRLFRNTWAAALVSLLFGLHPMTVDSICWLSERKTVLATFFALSSLILYVQFARRTTRRHYVACLLMYVLALLAKPIVLSLPVVMLLLDYWPLNRLCRRSAVEKLPLLGAGTVLAAVICVSQAQSGSVAVPTLRMAANIPLMVCHSVAFYLGKMFWPSNISAYYYAAPNSIRYSSLNSMIALFLVLALFAAAIALSRRTRAMLAGLTIFLVTAIPTMGLVRFTDVLVANRYVYLPSLGLLLLLGGALARVLTQSRPSEHTSLRHSLVVGGVLAIAAIEGALTRYYLHHWTDTVSLHRYMVKLAPDAPSLCNDLANALVRRGKVDEARQFYSRALDLAPWFPLSRCNLAQLLYRTEGKVQDAIEHCTFVTKTSPDFPQAHYLLGGIYLSEGDPQKAIEHLKTGVRLDPYFHEGRRTLARALLRIGHTSKAISELDQILQLSPTYLPAMNDLARLLATHTDPHIRDPDKAVEISSHAARLVSNRSFMILDTLAAAHAANGKFSEAIAVSQKALAIARRTRDQTAIRTTRRRLSLYQGGIPLIEESGLESPGADIEVRESRSIDVFGNAHTVDNL